MLKRSSTVMALVAMATALFTGVASAHIAFVVVDDEAVRSDSGNSANVTGDIKCTDGEHFAIRVELTQGSTVGRGARSFAPCLGDVGTGPNQDWGVNVDVVSGGPFVDGPATACYLAQTKPPGGAVDDSESGCEAVTIVPPNANEDPQ